MFTRRGRAWLTGVLMMAGLMAAGGVGYESWQQHRFHTDQTLHMVANQIRDRLDSGMFERYREIRNIAETNMRFRTDHPDLDKVHLYLEHIQDSFPLYAWIGFVGPDGTVVESTDNILKGENVSKRPIYTEGSKGPWVGDVHEAVLLAGKLSGFPGEPDEPLRFLDVVAPVRDAGGKLLGILAGHIGWFWATEITTAVLGGLPEHDHGIEAILLNRDHRVILGPRTLKGKIIDVPANGRVTMPDGDFIVASVVSQGHRDYPGFGWTFITRTPSRAVDIPTTPALALIGALATSLIGLWGMAVSKKPSA